MNAKDIALIKALSGGSSGGSGGGLVSCGLNIVLTAGSDGNTESNVTYDQVVDAFDRKAPIRFYVYEDDVAWELPCSFMQKYEDGRFEFSLAEISQNTAAVNILVISLSSDGHWTFADDSGGGDAN